MPTIISRGAGSASGFGFGSGRGATLQTVTFTISSVWVAPAGVTLVTTLSGIGQNGSPAYWGDFQPGSSQSVSYVENSAPSGISSATIESRAQAEWDKLPTSYTPDGVYASWTLWYYYVNRVEEYPRDGIVRVRNGFSKTKIGNGWGSSYTTPSLGASYRQYAAGNLEQYYGEATGDSASALGYTFPGGVGGPATGATYNNVTVTPGNSYVIYVPSGAAVTIQYYA